MRHEVLGILRPDQVLPHTGPARSQKKFLGHMVKMGSLRYQCFKKSLKCVCCGIEGIEMLLELPRNETRPHFNLYAKREGRLVLMTKDHIHPRSLGGSDEICNLRTMCSRCNELSGNYATKLKTLREIQDGVQTVYTVYFGCKALDGFATSYKGLEVITRKWVADCYGWNDDLYYVQSSFRLNRIKIVPRHPGNKRYGNLTLTIKPIQRV